jgi:hypothetical protein
MTSPEEAFLEGLAVGEVLKASAGDKLVWSQFDN